MSSKIQINIELSSDSGTLVAVLPPVDFGSLRERFIREVFSHLESVACTSSARYFLVDLSDVKRFGTAFLGRIVRLAKELRKLGKKLIISGDQWGLVTMFGLDQLCPCFMNRSEALRWSENEPSELTSLPYVIGEN